METLEQLAARIAKGYAYADDLEPQAVALAAVEEALAELQAAGRIVDGEALECCGRPVVGAEYMGQQEMICCGRPEPAGYEFPEEINGAACDLDAIIAGHDVGTREPLAPEDMQRLAASARALLGRKRWRAV